VLAGQFDGVAGDDIAYLFETTASGCPDSFTSTLADVHASTRSAFTGPTRWFNGGSCVSYEGTQFTNGDMNGDGLDDVTASIDPGNEQIEIISLLSSATSFTQFQYAFDQGSFPQLVSFVGGDFNGDGFGDVADAFSTSGEIDIDVHIH
jgi:hypothetical protein